MFAYSRKSLAGRHFRAALLCSGLLVPGVVGCGARDTGGTSPPPAPAVPKPEPITFPDLGPARTLAPGVNVHEVVLGTGPIAGKVWVYLPDKPAAGKLPCVLIAPAGSRLVHGMDLDEGDRKEHLPYVRAGLAVVAYAIAGPWPERPGVTQAEQLTAMRAFMAADAGLVNARRALDFALAKVPTIDAKRVYTAGHSSAATLALLFAENEPRLKACVAFAPATDVVKRLGRPTLLQVDQDVPGFSAFVERTSPLTNVAKLTCPVFLFHAQDDRNVPISDTLAFARALQKTNPNVKFVQVARGGHYEPMIRQGIPQAIRWLQALPPG